MNAVLTHQAAGPPEILNPLRFSGQGPPADAGISGNLGLSGGSFPKLRFEMVGSLHGAVCLLCPQLGGTDKAG